MCWYPPFSEILLQPCHFRQTARVEDGSAHALLLFVGVDTLFTRVGTVCECGDNKTFRLVAGDLAESVSDQRQKQCT
jgi:hypothetical protein